MPAVFLCCPSVRRSVRSHSFKVGIVNAVTMRVNAPLFMPTHSLTPRLKPNCSTLEARRLRKLTVRGSINQSRMMMECPTSQNANDTFAIHSRSNNTCSKTGLSGFAPQTFIFASPLQYPHCRWLPMQAKANAATHARALRGGRG